MKLREVPTDELAHALHEDITRADLGLLYRGAVLEPLQKTDFQMRYKNVFIQMVVATMTHSFMSVARLYDKAKSPFSITLEQLVNRVARERAGHLKAPREAAEHLKAIATTRERLARVRGNVFAHKAYDKEIPQITWNDLEEACDLAKRILVWYGSHFGQLYSFQLSGFGADSKRFVEAQIATTK